MAAAGASTVGAVALQGTGLDLFAEHALARRRRNAFSEFTAIAPSSEDVLHVAPGFEADVLISWGDVFRDDTGRRLRYGFNNDFLAYFPLRGSREGLLFANHEYPDPFFLHGYKPDGSAKSAAQVQEEQDSVGNSILHVKRRGDGSWKVVSPSRFNRRIYGDRPDLVFTGPLAGAPGIGASAHGTVGNGSGGITHGAVVRGELRGLRHQRDAERRVLLRLAPVRRPARGRGIRVQHLQEVRLGLRARPLRPPTTSGASTRRSAASGTRTRPSATSRARGSSSTWATTRTTRASTSSCPTASSGAATWQTTAGSSRPASSTSRAGSRRGGGASPPPATRPPSTPPRARARGWRCASRSSTTRRRSCGPASAPRSTTPTSPRTGRRTWRSRRTAASSSRSPTTARCVTRTAGCAGCARTATTRRRRRSPGATTPPAGRPEPGRESFSAPDNLVFDKAGNLWVVTDISTTRLNQPNEYAYHKNNAMFMIPTSGPNRGVAFRFANGPVECELTGPYFTPDEQTLFVNVQHPGETTGISATAPGIFGQEVTYTSWWPEGSRTAGDNPSTPMPSTVAIRRARPGRWDDD